MSSAYGAMTLSAAGGAAIAQQSTHASSPIDPRNLPQHSGRSADEPFGYCLNTSTIRGQKLPLVKELEIASAAGFQAVEPWINEVDQFVNEGGKLGDLKKRIADLRLSVESVIAFTEWIVDDDCAVVEGPGATSARNGYHCPIRRQANCLSAEWSH